MRDRRILPYNLRLKAAARTLRRDSTPAERKLWYEFLRDLFDGDSHFTEAGQARDVTRSAVLERLSLQVMRFTNAEVMGDFEGVCSRIQRAIAEKA